MSSSVPLSSLPGCGPIGIIGLGRMGGAFAVNLQMDGHVVVVHDRDPHRLEPFAACGAKVAETLGEMADCAVVLTSLPNDEALEETILGDGGLARLLRPGALHIATGTISPVLSRRLAEQHDRLDQGYVAAPVLGNPDLARARALYILAAGRVADMNKAVPLLGRLGQRVFPLGERAEAANFVKLAANVLTATTLEAFGEVLALMRKVGIDRHVAFDVFTNSLFDSKVHRVYGGKIVDEKFTPPGMAVPLAVKDLRLALAEAERAAVPMPAASLVHDRLVGLVARGWGDLDWSALGLLAARDAGLDVA